MFYMNANYVDVDGSAEPGLPLGDGESTSVAALRIKSQFSDEVSLTIEGRPESLLALAGALKRAAEQIVEHTARDPQLRRMYGLSQLETGRN